MLNAQRDLDRLVEARHDHFVLRIRSCLANSLYSYHPIFPRLMFLPPAGAEPEEWAQQRIPKTLISSFLQLVPPQLPLASGQLPQSSSP